MLAALAVVTMTACVVEEEASQVSAGYITVTGNNGGGSDTSTGGFSLSWTAPVIRSDGSPMSLAEIDGYRVYYGSTQGNYPDSVDVSDGTATSATISNVPVGEYYIVMTTYDSDGRESTQSGVVYKQAL